MSGNYCDGECDIEAGESVEMTFGDKWRGKRLPIQTTITKAKKVGGEIACSHGNGDDHLRLSGIDRVCKEASEMAGGLCLPCVRSGNDLKEKCEMESHK